MPEDQCLECLLLIIELGISTIISITGCYSGSSNGYLAHDPDYYCPIPVL